MRIAIIAYIFLSNIGFSQSNLTELKFDTKYYDAVDKWVVFPKNNSDSIFTCGFIYLDNRAGFTFQKETDFHIKDNELKNLTKDTAIQYMRFSLEGNTSLFSVLSEQQILALELPKQPLYLYLYKIGSEDVSYLKNEGYHYNFVGASNLALSPLLKAYEKEPHFEGLEFEIAFAYNALKQFEKAILILEKAIDVDPNNAKLYRELGFSYKNLNNYGQAETAYLKGINLSNSDFEKSEMAVNMAQAYFELRNKKKFDEWALITRKYSGKGSRYSQFIDLFEQNWKEKKVNSSKK